MCVGLTLLMAVQAAKDRPGQRAQPGRKSDPERRIKMKKSINAVTGG